MRPGGDLRRGNSQAVSQAYQDVQQGTEGVSQVRANLEARKARRECAKSLWRFAAKILDDDKSSDTTPAFNSKTAERFFTNTYSSAPKSFQCRLQPQPTSLTMSLLQLKKCSGLSRTPEAHPPPVQLTKSPTEC